MSLDCCGDPGDCTCALPVDRDLIRERLEDRDDTEHVMPYCPGGCGPIGIEDVITELNGVRDGCGFCIGFIEWRHV